MTALPTRPPAAHPAPQKGNIWDKENISETLAALGAGFLSSDNFAGGLGAAAQGILGRTQQLRDQQRKSVSYGGPGGQFEITTDAMGNSQLRRVPELQEAAEELANQKRRLSPSDNLDLRSRALFAINQLPEDQRADAYRHVMQNPTHYGIDVTGMPAEWSDSYGAVAGNMGMSVPQYLTQQRQERLADDRITTNAARVQQGDERVEIAKKRLPAVPPGARRAKPRTNTLAVGTEMNGHVYQGGDPSDRNNWVQVK